MWEKVRSDHLLGSTACWIAAVRAQESMREDRLFDPEEFLVRRGWKATLSQAGATDANHGRWPYPVIPTTMPDMPHNWFVTAQKEVL